MAGSRSTVIVGVDGSGRSHALRQMSDQFAARVSLSALPGDGDIPYAPWHRLGITAVEGVTSMVRQLIEQLDADAAIEIDDAHLLDEPSIIAITALAHHPVSIVMTRRPTIASNALAALDETLSPDATVVHLGARTADELQAALGGGADWIEIYRASSGLIALAELLHSDGTDSPPALHARVSRRSRRLSPAASGLLTALIICPDDGDEALSAAAMVEAAHLPAAMRDLVDAGFATIAGERIALIPAVARIFESQLAPAERRSAHARVASLLGSRRAPSLQIARHLRLARSWTPEAAEIYVAAGEQLTWDDPAAALTWYDDAIEAGVSMAAVADGRAHAALLLGRTIPGADDGVAESAKSRLIHAIRSAQSGRWRHATSLVSAAPDLDPLLAAPGLLALGRPSELRSLLEAAPTDGATTSITRFAEACLAACSGAGAVSLFVEAAAIEDTLPMTQLTLDDVRCVGATFASLVGDHRARDLLLDSGTRSAAPVVRVRRDLLRAFFDMRAGSYTAAMGAYSDVQGHVLTPRDGLLLAAIEAGLARRGGDANRQHEVWDRIAAQLVAPGIDLLSIEPLEELLIAAARNREVERATEVISSLGELVTSVGRPTAWGAQFGWLRLQVALASNNAEDAAAAVAEIAASPTETIRHRAQADAAREWISVLDRRSDVESVVAAGSQLHQVGLRWEAAQLTGQAALDQTDKAAEALLLRKAREHARGESHPERVAPKSGRGPRRSVPSPGQGFPADLTDREFEVAELKFAGFSTKEVASRLFTSAKTVESHVTRINAKLGCQTKAEFRTAFEEYRQIHTSEGLTPAP